MRFLLSLLLALWASVAVAEPVATTRKDDAQLRWLDATPGQRAAVLDKWRLLPETTRPPFAKYREKTLDTPGKTK